MPMLNFLAFYLVLNTLFFLPRYVLERKNSDFIPWKGLLKGRILERIQYLINRFNYDIFRLSADLFWGVGIVLLLDNYWGIHLPTWMLFVPLFFVWVYHLYYHFFENIYKVEPLFYRDFLLLKTGAQLFFRELSIANILLFFGIVGAAFGFYYLLDNLLFYGRTVVFSFPFQILMGIIGLMTIYSLLTYNYKAYGKIVFPWSIQSLWRNIQHSLSTKKYLDQFDFKKLVDHQPYRNIQLKNKPNIYFIPIESYGKILYTHPLLKENYHQYMPKLQDQLGKEGWHTVSHLSTAPITGGASWVSYTTALFGFDIKDQGTYLTLLNKEEMRDYQHLMRWLKQQGYRNYRLAPIAGFKDMKIPWQTYQDFYAIDEWIKFDQMDYKGKLYGFGPCPPDQFSLNFAKEYINKQGDHPFFLFFITQNSHSPFTPPYEVSDDWKRLATEQQKSQPPSASIFVQPKLKDYAKSIEYQLRFLSDFVSKEGAEDDIFILMGDHQPPTFPSEKDGLETPIHVICKNKAFIQNFTEYGFQPGFLADVTQLPMKHQGFLSLFIRSLAKADGYLEDELPTYRKDGLKAFE